jgi:hypothetical protein
MASKYYAPLPEYAVRNAMIDFGGLNEGIDHYKKAEAANALTGARQRYGNAMAEGRTADAQREIAVVDPRLVTEAAKHPYEMRALSDAEQERQKKMIAGRAQMFSMMDDTPEANAEWKAWVDSDPKYKRGIEAMGLDPYDRVRSSRAIVADALGVKDPTAEALKRAQTDLATAQAERARALAASGGAARTAGVTPIYGTNDAGEPVIGQLTNKGEFITPQLPPGFKLSTGHEKIDLGTAYLIKDKKSGATIGAVPKDVAGEAREKAKGGFEGKQPELFRKADAAMKDLERQHAIVGEDIDRALTMATSATTGFASLLSAIPGTPAHQLLQTLNTIKANVGFDKLQAMREASPTGGALGQVTEFENRLLQSVFGALEQSQNADELKFNLRRLKQTLLEAKRDRSDAFRRDFSTFGAGADTDARAIERARDAIARGAPRDAVIRRLQENGVDPKGL